MDVAYVCEVMWRLDERLSMTNGSTIQTSFQYAIIANKKGFISDDRGVQPPTSQRLYSVQQLTLILLLLLLYVILNTV